MPYIDAFHAPELLAVDSTLQWQLEAGIIFQARQVPTSPKTSRLLLAFLIVVDKATREYSAGRENVNRHMSAGGGIPEFIEGVGHFENCINSTKRALRLLSRLANQPDSPAGDRSLRKLARVWEAPVTAVRDAIEHIDNDIVSTAGLPDGSPHLLSISKDGLRLHIANDEVTFDALASTLQALFRAGAAMLAALPSGSAPTDA